MKKFLAVVLAAVMVFALAACGEKEPEKKDSWTVGICQLTQHPALDKATEGFIDAVKEGLGADKVEILNQNASGETASCTTIVNDFVSRKVDLIMANATPSLQAAAAATADIPILGTAVTHYAPALEIDNWTGTVGGNISGTSDLAPLDQQAKMIVDLFPEARNVAILYCSAEANSVYQAKVVTECLEAAGLTVNSFTFADSNDVATVTQSACAEADVLYIPTDNTAASCAEAIGNIAEPANIPIITGEEGPCKICGVATLTINYYDLGVTTGKMAAKILKGEADISTMPIEYFPDPVKKFNPAMAELFNVSVPEDYIAIEG